MIFLSISKIPPFNPHRLAQTQSYRIFTVNIVILPIHRLIEIGSTRPSQLLRIIFQKGMPILVTAILPCPYLVPIQKEPFLSPCLRHRFMDK